MAVTLNGTSAYLSVDTPLVTGYPHARFGWIKPSTLAQSSFAFGSGSSATSDAEFLCYVDAGSSGKVRAWSKQGAVNGTVNSTSNATTTWQPVLIVDNSPTSTDVYYASGAKVNGNTGQSPVFALLTRFTIGARPFGLNFWFKGDIAEVAVWQGTVPGQAEFDSLAAGAAPETILSASLVEHWSLLTQGATQTGDKGTVLTNGASTTQAGTHPITRSATGATINCAVGNAVAAGLTAAVTLTTGGLNVAAAIGNATAPALPATVSNFITTEVLGNNTTSGLVNQAVSYSWLPAGRIGSLTGVAAVDATGTTAANGKLTTNISHLTSGPGIVLGTVRRTNAVDDDVFYQAFA